MEHNTAEYVDLGEGSSPKLDNFQKVSIIPLVFLIFYEVSGGPFGVEDSVKAGGPLLALPGLFFFPFMWSIPEALITAEMGTMFPANGGYVVWVASALGHDWVFNHGWVAILLGVFSLLPFFLTGTVAAPNLKPSRWVAVDLGTVDRGLYMNTLFGNLNYWDSISTLAGEVDNPSKTLPKALFYVHLLVVYGYFFPLLIGTGTIPLDREL